MFSEILHGAMVSGSLIIAIGAQNLFVLKQGLMKNYIFWVSLICFICDFTLMTVGVLGVGSFISQSVLITRLLALFGAAFLFWYGFSSLRNALWTRNYLLIGEGDAPTGSLLKVILATLGVTLLNPHVYLDTVVIVGGIAGVLSAEQKLAFLIGAVSVSCLWFFGIGYGARILIPLFKQRKMWIVLDMIMGLLMGYLACLLLYNAFISA